MDPSTSVSIVILVFLALGVFLIYRAFRARKALFSEVEMRDLRARFLDLEKRVYWDPRHAILEGDKLLDLLLARRGYRGTLGEKLKKIGARLPNIQDVWAAHKMRNRIAHELGVKVEPREARRHVASYKKAYLLSRVPLDS